MVVLVPAIGLGTYKVKASVTVIALVEANVGAPKLLAVLTATVPAAAVLVSVYVAALESKDMPSVVQAEAEILPSICKWPVGPVVPMPTLPEAKRVILVVNACNVVLLAPASEV